MRIQSVKEYTHRGRVQRLFGIHIPPKKIPVSNKYLTLRFVVIGIIPSKKNDYYSENNYRFIMKTAFESDDPKQYLYDNLKSWIRGSKRYLKWVDDIDQSIMEQAEFWRLKYGLVYPLTHVSIKNYYYFADRKARDLPNKDESVYDMLVKKAIILDDNYSVLHKTSSDGYCYEGEINDHITTIDITVSVNSCTSLEVSESSMPDSE